jgi:hypothetical protein
MLSGHVRKPVTDVWESMNLDEKLSIDAVKARKATGVMMDGIYEEIIPYYEKADFPFFVLPKVRELGICGLGIKGFGSPGF